MDAGRTRPFCSGRWRLDLTLCRGSRMQRYLKLTLNWHADTNHLLNRRHIGQMKHGALIINTGRGSLIDTEALIPALESGISRNSVREAIRTLDIMGVITSQQGAGNYLTGNFEYNLVETMFMMFLLGQIDHKQISQLRRSLELQALLLSMDNISEREAGRRPLGKRGGTGACDRSKHPSGYKAAFYHCKGFQEYFDYQYPSGPV